MSFRPPFKSQGSGDYTPTNEQLTKWASEKATDKQKNVLKKMGMIEEELNNASKLDAYHTINNNKKENL